MPHHLSYGVGASVTAIAATFRSGCSRSGRFLSIRIFRDRTVARDFFPPEVEAYRSTGGLFMMGPICPTEKILIRTAPPSHRKGVPPFLRCGVPNIC